MKYKPKSKALLSKIKAIYSKSGNTTFRINYKPRAEMFSNSNGTLTFHPNTLDGFSYRWYKLCGYVNGKFYLNTANYSNTTNKHVRQLLSLFHELGVSFTKVECFAGLSSSRSLDLAIAHKATYMHLNSNSRTKAYTKRVEYWSKQIDIIKSIFNITDYAKQEEVIIQDKLSNLAKYRDMRLAKQKAARFAKRHEKFNQKFEALLNKGEANAQA